MKKLTLFSFALICTFHAFSQVNLDSLWNVWQDKTKPDTSRLAAMEKFVWKGYLYNKPDSALYFANMEYDFAKSRGLHAQVGNAMNTMGIAYAIKSDFVHSMDYFNQLLAFGEEHADKKLLSFAYGGLGADYQRMGDFTKAMENYEQSLKLKEELADEKGIAQLKVNLGMIYANQGNYDQAFQNYQSSLELFEKLGNKQSIATTLSSIGAIYFRQDDHIKALDYYQRALKIREEMNDRYNISSSLNSIGQVYADQGDYPRALSYFEHSLEIRKELSDKPGIATTSSLIGTIYSKKGEYKIAEDYFQQSLAISEEMHDQGGIASAYGNIGANHQQQNQYDQSMEYYQKSLAIYTQLNNKTGMATMFHNMGNVLSDKGDFQKGRDEYNQSLEIYKDIPSKYGIANCLIDIGISFMEQKTFPSAITWCQRGLATASELDLINEQKNACQCLYKSFKGLGQSKPALAYHEKMTTFDDSLHSVATTKKLQQIEFQKLMLADSLDFAKQQAEKDLAIEKQQANISRQRIGLASTGGGVLLLVALAFSIYKGKKRADELLLNILPAEIAEELKANGKAESELIEEVTVIFTDFQGFTQLSENMDAKELVEAINELFSAFDLIMTRYGVEKIKTIGDAYMAAGGLPTPNKTHAIDVVKAALDIRDVVEDYKQRKMQENQPYFEIRIGMHTGHVVAGIVGVKKYSYDIWGDTVNIANRMESNCEVGKVNVSEKTYEMLKDEPGLTFINRGKIEVKGKGEIEMWYVNRSTEKDSLTA